MKEMFYTLRSDNELVKFRLIGVSYCDGTYKISRKNSDVYVIEYIIDGEGVLEIDGEVFYPKKGDVYFVQPSTNHKYFSDKENPWKKVWVNVTGSLVDLIVNAYSLTGKYYFENLDIQSYLTGIIDIAKNGKDAFEAELLLQKILLKMHLHSPAKKVKTDAQRLKDYIDCNVRNPIKINDMSSFIGKSPSQITKDFKNEFKISPYEYLIDRKISLAKNLLNGTGLTVRQIALLLSFADEYYFSNVFKKRTGISPKFYRKNQS